MSDKYDYNRFGSKAKRVGQAVVDILSKEHLPSVTAEDIAEGRQKQYIEDLYKAIEVGHNEKKYSDPFYVVYLYNKEPWAVNVVRGRFCPRQTEPVPENMMTMFPYFGKDVWEVHYNKGDLKYLWTLPSMENFKQIVKNAKVYDENLAQWTASPIKEKTPFEKS